ncbi:hypothetical protein ACUXST_000389 [Sphingomonas sp. F9_3S_D5_B_2]
MIDDRGYYRRRIEQEQRAAKAASSALAQEIHLELVELYATQLRLLEGPGTAPLDEAANPWTSEPPAAS